MLQKVVGVAAAAVVVVAVVALVVAVLTVHTLAHPESTCPPSVALGD